MVGSGEDNDDFIGSNNKDHKIKEIQENLW